MRRARGALVADVYSETNITVTWLAPTLRKGNGTAHRLSSILFDENRKSSEL